jgi:hypothetical protein
LSINGLETGGYVFLCHSGTGRKQTDQIRRELEENGVRCWVSYRDIPAGADWAETIYDAIAGSKALVFLHTSSANESRQIRNELDIATNLKVPIIPVRLDKSQVSRGIQYFTNSHQWLFPESSNAGNTAGMIAASLMRGEAAPPVPPQRKRLSLMLFVPVLAILAAGWLLLGRREGPPSPDNLFNLVGGGTVTWNYASDVVSHGDGGFTASGVWDWGFWSEAWVTRFDARGNPMWSWCDSLPGECRPRLLETADGGVIAGFGEYADSIYTGYSVRAVRLDSLGEVVWDSSVRIDWDGSIQPIFGDMGWQADGTAVMAFTMRRLRRVAFDATHIVELNPDSGEMEWSVIPERKECVAYLPLDDGGTRHVYLDVLSQANGIEVIGSSGETICAMVTGDMRSQATAAAPTHDHGVLLGVTEDRYGPGKGDIRLTRFSENLSILWSRSFGGDLWEAVSTILPLPCGGFLVAASTRSFGDGSSDGWLLRLNSSGDLLWETILDLGGNERIMSAAQESDGSFLVSGFTTAVAGKPDAWIGRVSPSGEWVSSFRLGTDIELEDWRQGFIDQSRWLMGMNRNYAPNIQEDTLSGGFSIDLNGVPLLHRNRFVLSPGFSVSVVVHVPDREAAAGNNWFCLGLTSGQISDFHRDPASVPLCELKWNYTGDTNGNSSSILFARASDGIFEERTVSDSGLLLLGAPQLMTIEVCRSGILFLLNHSHLHTAEAAAPAPDSAGVYIWGNSNTLGHRVQSVRLFHRRW